MIDRGPEPGPDHLPQRFHTGVPNLDAVLGGGLLRGTIVMVIGPPGSGKSILAQQIAFMGAQRGDVGAVLHGLLRNARQAAGPQSIAGLLIPR